MSKYGITHIAEILCLMLDIIVLRMCDIKIYIVINIYYYINQLFSLWKIFKIFNKSLESVRKL